MRKHRKVLIFRKQENMSSFCTNSLLEGNELSEKAVFALRRSFQFSALFEKSSRKLSGCSKLGQDYLSSNPI